jgi:hypothetical protein
MVVIEESNVMDTACQPLQVRARSAEHHRATRRSCAGSKSQSRDDDPRWGFTQWLLLPRLLALRVPVYPCTLGASSSMPYQYTRSRDGST